MKKLKTVEDYFLEKKSIKSDINEHLDTFVRYGKECETITEMGVRGITSTWAWMMSNPKKLVGIDFLNFNVSLEKLLFLISTNFQFFD